MEYEVIPKLFTISISFMLYYATRSKYDGYVIFTFKTKWDTFYFVSGIG